MINYTLENASQLLGKFYFNKSNKTNTFRLKSPKSMSYLFQIQKKLMAVILMLVIIAANTKAEEEYASLNPEGRTCECRHKCLEKEIPTSPPPSAGLSCVGDPDFRYCCEV